MIIIMYKGKEARVTADGAMTGDKEGVAYLKRKAGMVTPSMGDAHMAVADLIRRDAGAPVMVIAASPAPKPKRKKGTDIIY